uniref:Uncharacterized protein n=1 Tax=Plectus sambesii TaxID=2011161 RepID=A0A914XK83_9BILA
MFVLAPLHETGAVIRFVSRRLPADGDASFFETLNCADRALRAGRYARNSSRYRLDGGAGGRQRALRTRARCASVPAEQGGGGAAQEERAAFHRTARLLRAQPPPPRPPSISSRPAGQPSIALDHPLRLISCKFQTWTPTTVIASPPGLQQYHPTVAGQAELCATFSRIELTTVEIVSFQVRLPMFYLCSSRLLLLLFTARPLDQPGALLDRLPLPQLRSSDTCIDRDYGSLRTIAG